MDDYEHGRPPDHHWMTFSDLCHVCDLDYNYIAKVETMSADAAWLLPKLFQQDAALSKSWRHSEVNGRQWRHLLPTLNGGDSSMISTLMAKIHHSIGIQKVCLIPRSYRFGYAQIPLETFPHSFRIDVNSLGTC